MASESIGMVASYKNVHILLRAMHSYEARGVRVAAPMRKCVNLFLVLCSLLFNSLSWKAFWISSAKCNHEMTDLVIGKFWGFQQTGQIDSGKFWKGPSATKVSRGEASTPGYISVAPERVLWLGRGIRTRTRGCQRWWLPGRIPEAVACLRATYHVSPHQPTLLEATQSVWLPGLFRALPNRTLHLLYSNLVWANCT